MTDRDRLIELFKEMDEDFSITCPNCNTDKGCRGCKYQMSSALLDCNYLERKVDYLLANGVIVPPCKVGDWLWVVRKDYVSECFRVDGFDDKNFVMYMQDNEHNFSIIYKGIKIWRISFDDFGKTVFLTKEEAEQKLKELGK